MIALALILQAAVFAQEPPRDLPPVVEVEFALEADAGSGVTEDFEALAPLRAAFNGAGLRQVPKSPYSLSIAIRSQSDSESGKCAVTVTASLTAAESENGYRATLWEESQTAAAPCGQMMGSLNDLGSALLRDLNSRLPERTGDDDANPLAQVQTVSITSYVAGDAKDYAPAIDDHVAGQLTDELFVVERGEGDTLELRLRFWVGTMEYDDCVWSAELGLNDSGDADDAAPAVEFKRSGSGPCSGVSLALTADARALIAKFLAARESGLEGVPLEDPPNDTRFEDTNRGRALAAELRAGADLQAQAEEAERKRERRRAILEALVPAAHSIGCAAGGGYCNSGTSVVAEPAGCNNDFQCGVGEICARPGGSYGRGICAKPTNRAGVQDFKVRRGGIHNVEGCSYDTQCPVGFRCSKQGYSLKGVCVR